MKGLHEREMFGIEEVGGWYGYGHSAMVHDIAIGKPLDGLG